MSGVLETNAEVDSAVKPEEAKGIKSFQTGKKHFHNIMPTREGQIQEAQSFEATWVQSICFLSPLVPSK